MLIIFLYFGRMKSFVETSSVNHTFSMMRPGYVDENDLYIRKCDDSGKLIDGTHLVTVI